MPSDAVLCVESSLAGRSIKDLLIEQQAVAVRVLHLNREIAGRLESHQQPEMAQPQQQQPQHQVDHQQQQQQQQQPREHQKQKRQEDDKRQYELEAQPVKEEQEQPLAVGTAVSLQLPHNDHGPIAAKALTEPLIDKRTTKDSKAEPSLDFLPSSDKRNPSLQRDNRSLSTTETFLSGRLTNNTFCRRLVDNQAFVNFTLGVIVFNTLWIAVDTDYNHADVLCKAPVVFQVVNNLFCTFFSFELLVRLLALQSKGEFMRDKWMFFDMILVSQMVWETWVQVAVYLLMEGGVGSHGSNGLMRGSSSLRIFRIFRLARVFRMSRLLRIIPELMVYVKGMMVAMRSVFAILIMLLLVIYVFAIIFTQMLWDQDVPGGTFHSVPQSMRFLLHQVLCGFDSEFMVGLMSVDLSCYMLLVIYWLVASLTIMNMLIGVLCDVMASVSEAEKEEVFTQILEDELRHMAELFDDDGSNTISVEEFNEMMKSQSMLKIFTTLGVDTVALAGFIRWEYNDRGVKEIAMGDFEAMVIQFRGSKHATVRDIVFMRKYMSTELAALESRLQKNY